MDTLISLVLCFGCVKESNQPQTDESSSPQDSAMVESMLGDAELPTAEREVSCSDEDELTPPDAQAQIGVGFDRNDLYLCADTVDEYLLETSGQVSNVRLRAEMPELDLDLAVYTLDEVLLVESAGESGTESVQVNSTLERVLVRVSGYQGASGAYALSVDALCLRDSDCADDAFCNPSSGECTPMPQVSCGGDEFEPNDRQGDAAPLTELTTVVNAVICEGDRDWYEIEIVDGADIEILLSFEEGFDLDVRVFDAETAEEMTAALGDVRQNPERLRLSFFANGRYLIGIDQYVGEQSRGGSTEYRLELLGRSGLCETDRDCRTDEHPTCDDGRCRAAMGDGTFGEACGRDDECQFDGALCYTGGGGGGDNFCSTGCQSDADCSSYASDAYCQPISWRSAICVPGCEIDADCGVLSRCVESRCQQDERCRQDRDCAEGRACRFLNSGERICGQPPATQRCGLDEDLEPNHDFGSAQTLPLGQIVQDLRICNPDVDIFRFEVPSQAPDNLPSTMTIEVSFRAGVDIDVYVYDALGNLIGQAISPDQSTEVVEIPYLKDGAVFVRIDQFSSDQLTDTSYSILASVLKAENGCTEMGAECLGTTPLRLTCQEDIGACVALEGEGRIALGGTCDSRDDCIQDADFCGQFGEEPLPICTLRCETNAQCAAIPDAVCTPIRRGLAVCL